MSNEPPTTSELDRRLEELRDEMRAGFSRLETMLTVQAEQRITRDVYQADQRRLDIELANMRREVHTLRRFLYGVIGSVVATAATFIALGA